MSNRSSRSHSRRNSTHLNFSDLSLSPLLSRDVPSYMSETERKVRSSSYLQGLAAPNTPSFLSNDEFPFPFQRHNRNWQSHESKVIKSKSSSHLSQRNSSEWILRTGAILSAEARDTKGQGWLVSRASSTGLLDAVDLEGNDGSASFEGRSKKISADATYSSFKSLQSSSLRDYSDPFRDTIDDDEGEDDDSEAENIGQHHSVGFAGLVDRLMNLFTVEEDPDEFDGFEDAGQRDSEQSLQNVKQTGALYGAGQEQHAGYLAEVKKTRDIGEDGWLDAAWLFSIAAKSLS